jgi:hypothetical protein
MTDPKITLLLTTGNNESEYYRISDPKITLLTQKSVCDPEIAQAIMTPKITDLQIQESHF